MYPIMSVVLLLVSLGLVGYPFWQARHGNLQEDAWTSSNAVMPKTNEMVIPQEKERLMTTLSEIEFDYHMKKLSDSDYRNLKSNYAHAALAVMDAENFNGDGLEASNMKIDTRRQIEQEIEEELRALSVKKDTGDSQ